MDTMTYGESRYPRGDLRVSDADRDRAISELSEAFQAGRLTAEEFEERSDHALRARTGNDIAKLLADLPRNSARSPAGNGPGVPETSPRPFGLAVVPRILLAAPVIAVLVTFAIAGGHHGHHHYAFGLFPVLAALLFVTRMARRAGRRGYRRF
jgi:hypothetical protein